LEKTTEVNDVACTYGDAACVTVSVLPLMLRVPKRVEPGLGSKLKTMFVLPAPLWFAGLRCNQGVSTMLVQGASGGSKKKPRKSLRLIRGINVGLRLSNKVW